MKGTGFSEHVLGIIKHYIEEAELADVMEVLLKSLTTMVCPSSSSANIRSY